MPVAQACTWPKSSETIIFAPLIRFALPVLLALFLQTMYGACDLLFVGQFGGGRCNCYGICTGGQRTDLTGHYPKAGTAFSLKDIRPKGVFIKEILKIGIPVALQDLLASISFLVILSMVNSLGLIVSAGVGVAEKRCGFLMLAASAYMQSMSAFVAQNIGAGKPERASSLAVGILMGLFTIFRGDILAGIFAKDTEIILAAAEYLKAYAIDCVFTSFRFCFMGYFNGCGRTTFDMLQGTLCAFGVRMPVTWLMSKQIPVSLFHIGLGIPAATILQIVFNHK